MMMIIDINMVQKINGWSTNFGVNFDDDNRYKHGTKNKWMVDQFWCYLWDGHAYCLRLQFYDT